MIVIGREPTFDAPHCVKNSFAAMMGIGDSAGSIRVDIRDAGIAFGIQAAGSPLSGAAPASVTSELLAPGPMNRVPDYEDRIACK